MRKVEEHYMATRYYFDKIGLEKQGYFAARGGVPYRAGERVRRQALQVIAERGRCTSILEAGCGRGDFSARLALAFPQARVVGMDFSTGMLRVAAAYIREVGNLQFVQADLLSLPFAESQFDVVVCLNTLQHIHRSDLDLAISEMAGKCREMVVLEIRNRNSLWYLGRCLGWLDTKCRGTEWLPMYPTTVGEMVEKWSQHGFRLQHLFWEWTSVWPLSLLCFERL